VLIDIKSKKLRAIFILFLLFYVYLGKEEDYMTISSVRIQS